MSHKHINREADALFVEAQHAKTGPEQKAVDAKFQEDRARMKPEEYAQLVHRIEADNKAAHAKHPHDYLPSVFISDNRLVSWVYPTNKHK
jgi:hypothetical protein